MAKILSLQIAFFVCVDIFLLTVTLQRVLSLSLPPHLEWTVSFINCPFQCPPTFIWTQPKCFSHLIMIVWCKGTYWHMLLILLTKQPTSSLANWLHGVLFGYLVFMRETYFVIGHVVVALCIMHGCQQQFFLPPDKGTNSIPSPSLLLIGYY